MRKPITLKEILNQLKADLIGKDSYRGATLTYSWLANQFGHFSLGYIPTLICYVLLKKYSSIQNTSLWSALIITIAWVLFELYNFLGPLLLKKQSESKLLFVPTKEKYIFQPAWTNIAFDTFTDLCFFSLGAFSASIFLFFLKSELYVLCILSVVLIYPCGYWFRTKMYLQYAQFPFQFRLSQWNSKISNDDKKIVKEFLKNKSSRKHLFVFGGRQSGKTSISVGISAEYSIKHKTCVYTTGMKLYSMFFEAESNLKSDKNSLWTWREASLLVIDDINPGDPIKQDLVSPQQFLDMLDTNTDCNKENRDALKNKSIIWVMGNENIEEHYYISWQQMLKNIGIGDVNLINLPINHLQ